MNMENYNFAHKCCMYDLSSLDQSYRSVFQILLFLSDPELSDVINFRKHLLKQDYNLTLVISLLKKLNVSESPLL